MAKKKVGKKGKADDQDDSKFSSERISPASEAANDNPETTEEPEKSVFELLGEDDEDGGLMNMISRSVKKKGKKVKPSKADFSGSDNDDKFGIGALAALGSDEEEDVFGQIVSKKKNKKDKKGAISFDSLGDLDISDPEIALPSKKPKKKKSKKELPAFDALDEEDILDAVEETQELDSAPKSKGKKSKKSKDLPAFDEPFDVEQDEVEKEVTPPTTKKGKKNKKDDELDALAALIEDDSVPAPAASNVKPKKGKKKKTDDDLDALAALIEDSTVAPTPAPKNKKGKNKKKADDFDDAFALENQDEDPTASKDAHLTPEAEPEIKIKSAKQKEKERKERQKEEKKRQAALQKAQEDSSADLSQAPAQKAETETAKGKGKKGKGPSAAILALRKQQEALRAAEEEAARLMEEEKKRIEEEERREAEEEAKKEQARQEKKQRELEKREQLRKEGKLLTKAQKEAKRKQELRLQSLVASGMKIAAFEEKAEVTEGEKPKRIIYNDRKKRGKGPNADNSTSPATPPPASIPEPKPEPEEVKAPQIKEVKDSWDDSEDDVKDNWEDSDDQESADKDDEAAATKEKDNVSVPTQGEDKASDQESSEGSDDSDDSDGSYDSDESDSEEELTPAQRQLLLKKQEAAERRKQRIDAAMAARSKDDLRSPICCILGHVDTGKTKLLDKIRQTNVQEGEAGGITQQIGATYFPVENIIQKTAILGNNPDEYNLPGLLVIDTPGHESFTNLRTRGSSLCNIAILVVDLMHGLEPQTLESIRLLRDRKTPFIVALNKIDRIYDWNPTPDNGFLDSFSKQKKYVQDEFDTRVAATITAFAEQGLNAKLYYENKNFAKYVSFVPTSAITGEGIPDLLHLLVTLTQSRLTDRLMYVSELECTVLEVKVIEGLGTTIDVVLSNGYLNEGDRIVVCGLNGPIVTQVRALLTPQPLRELRIKSAYVHHKRVKAALGIKISAPDLEKAIAGSRLLVLGPDDDEDELKDAVMEDLQTLLSSIDKSGRGVSVQASTLGSLEALLEFLRVSKIPVSAINIGPVHKKDIIRASAMLEKAKEFAVMLAFDVEVDKDASQLADQLGVRVFTADIIYHLFDQFTAFNKEVVEQRRKEQAPSAVFPCVLKMIPGAIFSRRDPIILGADVVEGALRIGTPICVVQFDAATKKREVINLGVVTGIENNHKPVEIVKKGMAGAGVAVKIECPPSDTPKLFGRHFTEKDALYSCITRRSINVLKESFRDDLSKDEWALVVKLKKILDVV